MKEEGRVSIFLVGGRPALKSLRRCRGWRPGSCLNIPFPTGTAPALLSLIQGNFPRHDPISDEALAPESLEIRLQFPFYYFGSAKEAGGLSVATVTRKVLIGSCVCVYP